MYQSMPVTRDLTSALSRSSSFSNFCFSYRRLFIAVRSSLLRIALSSLWFVYGKLKFMNFGTTPNLLQVNKNFISHEALSHFKDNFSNFRKVLTDINPLYLLTMSYIMFP